MSITFPMMPGIEINLWLIILLGFSIGMISGFAGVGGGFMMTPALMILGFPAQFAVGTSMVWVMSNSIIGALRHRQHGNVDVKLGLIIAASGIVGVEVGVRILNWATSLGMAETVVLMVSIITLLTIGGYTFYESCRSLDFSKNNKEVSLKVTFSTKLGRIKIKPVINFAKSEINISLWMIFGIGLGVGTLSGLLGVGGGFIMVPSLIYLVGLSSFLAVGTDLFQIIFSSAYGSIRDTMSGDVIIFAAFILILSSAFGVQCGVWGTRLLKGVCVKLILSFCILIAVLGSILKLINVFTGNAVTWLTPVEMGITFGGLGLILIMIVSLLFFSIRYNAGKSIPQWLQPLITSAGT